ncbi:PIGX1 [Auxenochlorella protothecoides x Auxenochlorella symbiontica]
MGLRRAASTATLMRGAWTVVTATLVSQCIGAAALGQSHVIKEALEYYCGPSGNCPLRLQSGPVVIRRVLEGSGAHRSLVVSVPVTAVHDTKRLLLLQPLPAEIFADVYQLQSAAAVGEVPPTLLHGRVDVENITLWADPTVLAVELQLAAQETAREELLARVPLHARYPLLLRELPWWRSLHAGVELPPPQLLLVPGAAAQSRRAPAEEVPAVLADSAPLIWRMPAGNQAASEPITWVSAAAVILATSFLLWTAATS